MRILVAVATRDGATREIADGVLRPHPLPDNAAEIEQAERTGSPTR